MVLLAGVEVLFAVTVAKIVVVMVELFVVMVCVVNGTRESVLADGNGGVVRTWVVLLPAVPVLAAAVVELATPVLVLAAAVVALSAAVVVMFAECVV